MIARKFLKFLPLTGCGKAIFSHLKCCNLAAVVVGGEGGDAWDGPSVVFDVLLHIGRAAGAQGSSFAGDSQHGRCRAARVVTAVRRDVRERGTAFDRAGGAAAWTAFTAALGQAGSRTRPDLGRALHRGWHSDRGLGRAPELSAQAWWADASAGHSG